MSETDAALARAAQGGDRGAFESLIRRHGPAIYGLCRRHLGDRDDALDMVQEIFAAAWTRLSGYDPSRPLGPWLRAIALNRCRDFGRRRAVRRLATAAFAREPIAAPSQPHDGEEPRLAGLDRAIAALPSAYKEAILLTVFGGLSQQDAADELGVSVKTLEMRLYRARKHLATRLASDPVGETVAADR